MSGTPGATAAWRNAEARLYDYLKTALVGEEGVTAYAPDDGLPRTVNAVEDAEMWTCEIMGGGDCARIQARPRQSWNMQARFIGVFTTRTRAQRVCGILMDRLPVESTDNLTGVRYASWDGANPTIERDVMELAPDQEQGGEVRVWRVTYPLHVVFNNVTEG